MVDIEYAIIIASIWIACGVYSYSKKESDTLWGAFILTILLINPSFIALIFLFILLLMMR